MGRPAAPGFHTVQDAPFRPIQRATKTDVYPYAVKPAAVATPWRDIQPTFFNRVVESLVADVSTPIAGGAPTPGFTMGDADVAATVLKVDRLVRLRLYLKIGAGTKINTLVRDNGAVTRSGTRGNTFMRLPYKIANGNAYQFNIFNYTFTRGPVANNSHGNQSAYFFLPKIAPNSDELPISIWDTLPGSAANPGDAVLGFLQAYWSTGDIYDLQFEYETDDIS